MLGIVVSVVLITYTILILVFWLGWEKAQPCNILEYDQQPITIAIAVRNEEENIGNLLLDIEQQDYPKNLIELIIIDDHSTDDTISVIKNFTTTATYTIISEGLDDITGKKAAIAKAISLSTNEIILTTDGDCRVPPEWLSGMTSFFVNDIIQLVSGPVRIYPQETFFQKLQAIEFASLIASGAATLTLGWPTMANAANMAFRKKAFLGVNVINSVKSGDDVFLLHAVSQQFKNGSVFCRDEKVVVDTGSSKDIKSFYHQRKRWSGKWSYYNDWPTRILAVYIFLTNLAVLALPVLVFFDVFSWEVGANLLVVKLLFEFWFLREIQKFFKSKLLIYEFITLAIGYPVYVTIMAVAGLIGKYQWKGRTTV